MEEFIFSINATIPVFLLILTGYFLRHQNILGKDFISGINKYVFMIGFPVLLFNDIAGIDMAEVMDIKYVLYCVAVTSVSFWGVWALSRIFVKDKTIRGSFVQGACRGSAASLGLAFIQNMYGNSGMAPLMIIGAVPLYNVFSVIILSIEANDKENIKVSFKELMKGIATNPIIIGVVVGIIFSVFKIRLPFILNRVTEDIAKTASPMALLSIGAGFELKSALAKVRPAGVSSFIKLIALPAVFIPVAVFLGFKNEYLVAVLIMLGSPATSNCYIMAQTMKNDGVLASSIVGITTLFAAVTLTFWIFVLKLNGLI